MFHKIRIVFDIITGVRWVGMSMPVTGKSPGFLPLNTTREKHATIMCLAAGYSQQ